MKSVLAGLLVFSCLPMAGQDAAEYLIRVESGLRHVQRANCQYLHAAVRRKPARVEKQRQAFMQAIAEASTSISELPSWNLSAGLRDSALFYLRTHLAYLTEDFGQVIDLSSVAESAFDPMEAYLAARRLVERRLDSAARSVEFAMRRFAEDNRVELAEDPGGKALQETATAMRNYRQVYDVFFACYKQEGYFIDALATGNVSSIAQNRDALARMSAEGLSRLETIRQQGGRQPVLTGLHTACGKLLTFYHGEATEALSEAELFFVQRDDLSRSEALSNVRPADHDQAAAAHMELARENFAKRCEAFNRTCAVLAKRRETLVSAFQRSADRYVKRHLR